MRFKVLAILSFVLIIIGVGSVGAVLQDLSDGIHTDTYLGSTMAACFITGGALLYWAAHKRYAVGWRIYLGSFLAFFGFVGASVEADNVVNLRAEDPVFGFVLACIFVVTGFLLARSGYWRNVKKAHARVEQPAETISGWQGVGPAAEGRKREKVVAGTGATRRD